MVKVKKIVVVLIVAIFIATAFLLGVSIGQKTNETTTQSTTETTEQITEETTTHPITTETNTTQSSAEETTQAITETTTQTEESTIFNGAKMYLYYKVDGEYKMQDITKYLVSSIENADPILPKEVEKLLDGDQSYIEPEIRVYGISKDASVTVIYETEASKASQFGASFNDGVTQFWHWKTRIYNKEKEGIYSFKVSVIEPDKPEMIAYFKVSVVG